MKKVQFLKETERGTGKYGASPFADLTEAEFRKEKLGLLKPKPMSELPSAEIPEVNLPAEFDWRHFNAVTPVKNQGRTLQGLVNFFNNKSYRKVKNQGKNVVLKSC
jgi:cathepsin F